MIFPSGNRKNLDVPFDPLSANDKPVSPRSADYVPKLKKNAKKERYEREEKNSVENPRSIDYQPQMRSGAPVKHDWAVASTTTSLADIAKNVLANKHSIGSARAGGLSDVGGPVRQMQTQTSNSIWNPAVLEQIKKGERGDVTMGEKIKADNQKLSEQREQLRKTNFHIDVDGFVEAYKRGDMSRGSTISPAHAPAADVSNYSSKVAPHEMSIFQSKKDYAALPEKTAGERIHEAAAERRSKGRKDRSWEAVSTVQNTRQKLSAFFDNLKSATDKPAEEKK